MRTRTLTLILAASLGGQTPPPAPKKAPATPAKAPAGVTFDQILQLVKLKFPEAAILKKIGEAKGLNPTTEQLIQLKSLGASDNVILALTGEGAAEAPAAAPAPTPTAPHAAARGAGGFPASLEGIACQASPQARKRVVAVEEFDYSAVMTAVQAIFGTHVNIGKGIRAMFVKRMQTEGKFRLVERAKIDKVIGEQDFGASGRVKKGTQAKIGQIIGSDAILMGDVVVFGRDDKSKGVGGGGFSRGLGAVGGIRIGSREEKAVVVVNYRLVDAESSEVIAAGEARGESARKSKSFDVGGYKSGVGGGAGGMDMTSSNFAETIVGEATMAAVDELAKTLNGSADKIQAKDSSLETRIADVAAPQVYLSAGAADGIQKCDRFDISRVVREVRDPATKEVIDQVTEPVGEMIVTEVRDRVAIGTFAGSQAPRAGFVARKRQ